MKLRKNITKPQLLSLLELNLFEQRYLIELLKPPDNQHIVSPQILLWNNL